MTERKKKNLKSYLVIEKVKSINFRLIWSLCDFKELFYRKKICVTYIKEKSLLEQFTTLPFIYCENLQRLIPEPINPNKVVIDSHTLSTTLHYISNGSNSLIVTTILLITRLSATVFHNSKRVLFYEIVLNIKARTLWASVIQFPCWFKN